MKTGDLKKILVSYLLAVGLFSSTVVAVQYVESLDEEKIEQIIRSFDLSNMPAKAIYVAAMTKGGGDTEPV